MRKLFSLFLSLVATTSLWAHDFEVDGIYYNHLDGNNVEVTRGDFYNSYSGYSGTVIIPETVTYNGTTYNVTSIGERGFEGCYSLASVTIGNSVTSIGYEAFYDCYYLISVTIGNSVTSIGNRAFYGCYYLTFVTIPNSVTSIGGNAFYDTGIYNDESNWENDVLYIDNCLIDAKEQISGTYTIKENTHLIADAAFNNCSSLTSITIPNSVKSIGNRAFGDCESLTSITIPNSVTSIGSGAFYGTGIYNDNSNWENGVLYIDNCLITAKTSISGTYAIKEDTRLIANAAFYNCSSLTSVTIPNSVTSIGDNAFQYCSSLTSITIPNSVTSIGDNAFGRCSSLTSVTIPNSVTSIEFAAFEACTSLTSVTIGNSVTSIGDWAFRYCYSLTSVTIPNSVTSIGNEAFYNCSALTSITIPNSVTSIGDWAFQDCSSLTSITIPNSVTSIGDNTFSYCSSLSSVAIGNGVTHINEYTFDGCTGLNLLRLGTGIQSIAADAFSDCTKLYDIYCLAAEPPTGYTSSFANYNAFIHVPCESQRLYMLDVLFGEFKYIECISSDEVTTDDIVITPGSTDVTIIWPTEGNADTYTIVIKKGNEVFCTLTFNAEGQLLNIAFAPGRDGNHPAQYAEQAGKGYRFTVTNLESGTKYGYNIEVKDASNKTIKSHSGEFTTQSTTAVDNITTNNANIQKIIRDGQFIIVRDGVEYNAIGQEM